MSSEIEIVHPEFPRGGFKAVLFDFDGTLSLLRRNWQDTMIPMMVEVLAETGTPETREALFSHVEDFVMRLNGRQTIYQMLQLAEEVAKRGGQPLDPLVYKRRYHDLLWQHVSARVESVRSGRTPRDELTVPGTRALLQSLRHFGLSLYLASGTDLTYVRDEATVLGMDDFFGKQIYGALDDYKKFSKAMIIQQILREMNVPGRQIVGFGDGFVEIEEIKKVGGLAIGVASNEESRQGINDWKRRRLIQAGADLIIPDYRELNRLLELVGITGSAEG
jgi:beta-phosphoglucomutase-like phosphatase (HAD superfamily)